MHRPVLYSFFLKPGKCPNFGARSSYLNVLNNRVGPDWDLDLKLRLLGFDFEKCTRDLNPSLLTEALKHGKKNYMLKQWLKFKKSFSPSGFYGMNEVNLNSNRTALLSFQPFICEDIL
jgi:hypothetical protein